MMTFCEAALMGTIVAATAALTAWRILGSSARDDERVLGAFLDAWDLSFREIGAWTRIGTARLTSAMARLEEAKIVERYEQGEGDRKIRRYTLTNKGREATYALERHRLENAR